ncbi:MAG: SIS domain-containing protein [Candidatus Brocadiae bacterium]|nr:SIS domain-containing protein [Candidatus Brocadiia bacterium]
MDIEQAIYRVLTETGGVFERADLEATERLIDTLLSARRIYVTGEGRTGLVARTFAMRLVHLGMTAYVCGETVTPAIEADDVCIACSASGETAITCHRAGVSRGVGATVVAITAVAGTPLGAPADLDLVLDAPTKHATASQSVQFGSTLFEQALLVFLDAVVLLLQDRRGASPQSMFAKHTNLE